MAKKPTHTIMACHDFSRRTCIQVERANGHVKFIPLDVSSGLEVQKTSVASFDQRFTPMEGYPAEKACQLYLSYSQNIGATKEALDYLGQVITISKQEYQMATTKKAAAAEKTAAKPATKKTPPAKPAAKATEAKAGRRAIDPVVKTPAKKTGDARVDRAKRVCATTNGAGGMILKLLREGKDHDAILSRVLSAFPDNATKPTHISWYQSMRRAAGEKVA